MTPRADWVLVGPEPYMAHCERCGATLAKPPMPCSFELLDVWTKDFLRQHARCPAPVAAV